MKNAPGITFPLPLALSGLAVLVLAILFLMDALLSPALAQSPVSNASQTSADELYCVNSDTGSIAANQSRLKKKPC